MKVASQRGLTRFQNSVLAWRRRIRHRVATTIQISDTLTTAEFRCGSAIEERRAVSLFHKEAGTVSWLRNSLKAGQVFVDVGANMGLYTVLAAQLVGPDGKVFAFEPHAVNFSSLMENIALNGLEEICFPISSALSNQAEFLPFHYASLTAGSSMSQLGRTVDPDGNPVDRSVSEIKSATSLDQLVDSGLVDSPHHIKIDVDGIEADIVEGMQNLLTNGTPPLTVQVEIQPDTRLEVMAMMEKSGFTIDHCHHTEIGQKKMAEGLCPTEITHNIVFARNNS